MRVEITCSDRVGILQEIMAIFAEFRVNVRTGEIGGDSGDKVYLWAPALLQAQFQSIEKALQRVAGVKRVRRIQLIPSERRHFELDTLLRHVSYPVLSVDPEGRIIAANLAAARAFAVSLEQVPGMQLQRFLPRLQLEELLRGLTAPRYGFPVTVRGRPFALDWSPITLDDDPSAVASLAGAVLTLQQRDTDNTDGPAHTPPTPRVLWDIDQRRECCLRLQQLAPLSAPLLITGERGSGKSTFLDAAYYLNPQAESGRVYRRQGRELQADDVAAMQGLRADAVVLVDDLDLASDALQQQLADAVLRSHLSAGLMATATDVRGLSPGLQQIFSLQQIHLPPLRAMRPAIARFAGLLSGQTVADSAATAFFSPREGASTEAEDAVARLKRSDWPTNFHGLAQVIQAALMHMRGRNDTRLTAADFPEDAGPTQLPMCDWGRGLTLSEQMEKLERGILEGLLQSLPPEQRSSRALARRLGISHTAVANKLRKYGLVTD